MRPSLLLSLSMFLAGSAHADPAEGDILGRGLDDVISVDSVSKTVLSFEITSCERFRSVVYDRRDPSIETSADMVVLLKNAADTTCWWDGIALQGTLAGSYTPRPRPPKELGLMLEPGGTLELSLHPTSGPGLRPVVELFVPPGKGIVILRADPDKEPPPLEPADDASTEAQDPDEPPIVLD